MRSEGTPFLSHRANTFDGDTPTRFAGTEAEDTTGEERRMTRQTGTRLRGLVIISTIAVALVLLLASAVQATGRVAATEEYLVRPGDTLWEIADEHGPDDRDVRDVIEAIRRLNRIDGSIIQPGQVLEIPVG